MNTGIKQVKVYTSEQGEMKMGWSKVRAKILHKILGEYLIELQAVEMMPEIRGAVREHLHLLKDIRQEMVLRSCILRDLIDEIKLLRVTGKG